VTHSIQAIVWGELSLAMAPKVAGGPFVGGGQVGGVALQIFSKAGLEAKGLQPLPVPFGQ
jgi:hypothetical protein